MAKQYGKNINLQKKYKKRASSQASGIDFKNLMGIKRILSDAYKSIGLKQLGDMVAVTSGTNVNAPIIDSYKNTVALSNPFYKYLEDNAITKLSQPVNENGAKTTVPIIPTGTANLIKNGEKFWIYHPYTFKSKYLSCDLDLTNVATTIRFSSAAFNRGTDTFPAGSFLVKDARIETPSGGGGGDSFRQVRLTGGNNYNLYCFYANSWYSMGTGLASFYGSGTTPQITSSSYYRRIVASPVYIAPRDCTVKKVIMSFFWDSSYLTGDAALEFMFMKIPLVDDNTGAITQLEITSTNNNGDYTEFTQYKKTWVLSGSNAELLEGQGFGVYARCTTGSGLQRMLIYGNTILELETT